MIDIYSFCLGSISILLGWKAWRVGYKCIPYIVPLKRLPIKNTNNFVIITGATDGIGLQFLKYIINNKYKVIAIGRNKEKLYNLKTIVDQKNQFNLITVEMDFTNQFSNTMIKQLVSQIFQKYKKISDSQIVINGLINCCGMAHFSKYQRMSQQTINKLNKTNINAFLASLQILYSRQLKLQEKPFFINIGSVVGQYPIQYSSIYSGVKAYQHAVLSALNCQSKNISFLNVKPNYVTTKMVNFRNSWDAVMPENIVKGSFQLLSFGRNQGAGCIKHELLAEFNVLLQGYFDKQRRQSIQRLQNIFKKKSKNK